MKRPLGLVLGDELVAAATAMPVGVALAGHLGDDVAPQGSIDGTNVGQARTAYASHVRQVRVVEHRVVDFVPLDGSDHRVSGPPRATNFGECTPIVTTRTSA